MSWRLWLETVVLDFKYGLRRLAKNPAFTIVACLSLALGIGANTAAFGVLYAVMLRALPVSDPGRLALVSTKGTGFQYSMSYPAYTYLRDHSSSLEGLVAFRAASVNVTTASATDRVTGTLVTGNYFDVLGVRMALGSPIQVDDDQTPGSGGPRGLVAVLSHQFWTRRFNADAGVIGKTIRVNGYPATVVGVAPEAFRGTRVGSLPDVFVPIMFASRVYDSANWLPNPRNNWLRIIGRLRPDVTLAQAQAEMSVVFRQFNQDVVMPLVTNDAARQRLLQGVIILEAGRAGLLEMGNTVAPSLFILMGLVGVVLLIACVNVANLLVARAERHHRETAISIALGATGTRLWSQNVVESLIITASGVACGLVLARWMRELLVQLVPANQEMDVTMDAEVFWLSVGVGTITAIAFGTVTAWRSSRVGVLRSLKGEDVVARLWLRKGLIVGQLALSIVVLVAAALFGQTLSRLRLVDVGFDRERVIIASTAPSGYTPERRRLFESRLLEEVRAMPGVVSAALAGHEPLDVNTGWNINIRSDPNGPPQQASASVAFVSPDYFATMGIPFVRGRDFTARDFSAMPRPVIVNENFVRKYLSGGDPIGSRVVNGTWELEIVGVVKDSASFSLRDLDNHMMYVSGNGGFMGGDVLHVRAAVAPAALTAAIEAVVRRIDPNVPVFNVRMIDQQLDRFLGRERTFARLSSAFGLLALLLSAVGLYGVIANAVNRRTKELGVRVALGAAPGSIVRLVVNDAALLVALGIGVGIPCAYLLGRAMQSLLFEVTPGDWRSVVAAVAALTIIAVASAWLPARRAARVDPLVALRSE